MEKPVSDSNPGWKRSFRSLWATQFQDTFGDNAYRWLVASFVIGLGLPPERQDFLINAATILFSLPSILFSPTGGYLADRYAKRSVILGTRLAETVVMGLALAGLATQSIPLVLGALFLRGVQSACFTPAKFGMLPEILPETRLSWGNGLMELGAFLAIITGTVAGMSLYSVFSNRLYAAGLILLILPAAGLAIAWRLPILSVLKTSRTFHINPFVELFRHWKIIRADRLLLFAVLGNTYFFMLAALLQTTVLYYGRFILNLSQAQIGLLQGLIGIGIGIGSFAAGYLSKGKIEYGLVLPGGAGLAAAGALLSLGGFPFFQVAAILAFMGFAAGFVIVPVMTIIQHRPAPEKKGGIIGAANQMAFLGIAVSGGLHFTLSAAGTTPNGIFGFASLMTIAASVCAVIALPDSLSRLLKLFPRHAGSSRLQR
jgi:acyl-[acyl-carrier-protein]-phospholipid O-acyltransferase/long-chain-fatty-acid--[acyl-carrier-protein] ligase